MNIGQLVWNSYHGILRFGTIKSKRVDQDGWAYYKVNWHEDNTYEDAMTLRKNLCGEDHVLQEYRKDKITTISSDFLLEVVKGHKNEF